MSELVAVAAPLFLASCRGNLDTALGQKERLLHSAYGAIRSDTATSSSLRGTPKAVRGNLNTALG